MEFKNHRFEEYDIQHTHTQSPELTADVGLQEVERGQTPNHPAGMLINPEYVPEPPAQKPTFH